MSTTKCYGNEFAYHHTQRCRPGRPLCKRARLGAGQATCGCPAYRFTHRLGSGLCYSGKLAMSACA